VIANAGGTLDVTSTPGRGTTFVIELDADGRADDASDET
jgi:signal transduction histidine kinase